MTSPAYTAARPVATLPPTFNAAVAKEPDSARSTDSNMSVENVV